MFLNSSPAFFFRGLLNLASLANFFPKWQKREKSVCVSVFVFWGFSSCQLFQHYVAKNVKDSLKHLLSFLDYSQIWLILLVNDCQFGYVTKLEKKTSITFDLFHFINNLLVSTRYQLGVNLGIPSLLGWKFNSHSLCRWKEGISILMRVMSSNQQEDTG